MQAKGIPGQLVLRGELTAELLPDEVGALWQPVNIDLWQPVYQHVVHIIETQPAGQVHGGASLEGQAFCLLPPPTAAPVLIHHHLVSTNERSSTQIIFLELTVAVAVALKPALFSA